MVEPHLPASPDQRPADVAVKNGRTALLYPSHAPLADRARGQGTWDLRACWTHVPPRTGNRDTILVYFHGHNGSVKVDADGACVRPDWATSDLFAGISPCTPRRYGLDDIADNARSKPIVLAPEVVDPDNGIRCIAGKLAEPNGLALLIGSCLKRLSKLATPSGAPYLPPGHLSSIRRLFVAAHSGGGIPLIPAIAPAPLFQLFPSDVVMLDCLYGHDGGGEKWCTSLGTGPRGIGNGTDQCSLLITTTGGSTEKSGDALVAALAQKLGFPKVNVAYEQQSRLPRLTAAEERRFDAPANEIAEISHVTDSSTAPSAANTAFISKVLKTRPIVYVKTNVAHDSHPTVFIPLSLAAARS